MAHRPWSSRRSGGILKRPKTLMHSTDAHDEPDTAAVFAAASSLWEKSCEHARVEALNLSDCYNGWDQLMREVMRIAARFERWSCEHVAFEEWSEVWPYFLGDHFGKGCIDELGPAALASFDEDDCLRVALRLGIPLWTSHSLPVPINVEVPNPVQGSGFVAYRIQTVRLLRGENEWAPFVVGDDPFDEAFEQPVFGLYGVKDDETLEHIADRETYQKARQLAQDLAPQIALPERASSAFCGER